MGFRCPTPEIFVGVYRDMGQNVGLRHGGRAVGTLSGFVVKSRFRIANSFLVVEAASFDRGTDVDAASYLRHYWIFGLALALEHVLFHELNLPSSTFRLVDDEAVGALLAEG